MLNREFFKETAMNLTLELPDNKGAALEAKAHAQGVSTEQYVRQIVDRDLEQPTPLPPAQPRRHISEIILDIMSDVPREAFESLPRDGASEHDHYLYGSPKKNQ
jgi:hypothetical protein